MPFPGFPVGFGFSPFLAELPVASREEGLLLFVEWFREGDNEARDELVDAIVEAWGRFSSDQADYAASANPAHATGSQLDLAGSSRGMPRQPGESDADYRARLLADEDVGTPSAILAAIDRILARVTTKQAYYYERPDDDAFVFRKNTVDADGNPLEAGTYLHRRTTLTGHPIRRPSRVYSARTRCAPRHVFLFRSRRLTSEAAVSTAVGTGVIVGGFKKLTPATDDGTAPDNGHGHCVIGLPAFIQPGKSLSSDCAAHRKPDAPLLEAWGDLTEATAKRARLLSSVFTKATMVARRAAGKYSGPAIYRKTSQPDIIVGEIQAVLEHRKMYPVQFTLMFDPTL